MMIRRSSVFLFLFSSCHYLRPTHSHSVSNPSWRSLFRREQEDDEEEGQHTQTTRHPTTDTSRDKSPHSSQDVPLSSSFFFRQSSARGDNYAGGMSFDVTNQMMYITGSTYTTPNHSACFVSEFDVKQNKTLWYKQYSGTFGSACSSITHFDSNDDININNNDMVVIVGQMEQSPTLRYKNQTLVREEDTVQTIAGFVLGVVDDNINNSDSPHYGKIVSESKVQYPMSVAKVPNSTDVILAMMSTDDDEVNLNYELQEEYETEGRGEDLYGGAFKYGSSFEMQLERLTFDGTKWDERWTRIYGTKDREDVRVSEVRVLKGYVLVVGTTAGHGEIFGDALIGDKDLDGFVTKLSLDTGMPEKDNILPYSQRIQTDFGNNEIVTGMCMSKRSDARSLYIVGSTTGILDPTFQNYYSTHRSNQFNAFLLKLDFDTLQQMWTRQVGSYSEIPQDVLGMGCAVDDDDSVVYLSGIVTNGASVLENLDKSQGKGGNDVFVAGYDTLEGEQDFIKQVGTSKNDFLPRGSGGITTDENGNAIILGMTRGNMFRAKKQDDDADIFLMSFQKYTGNYQHPFGNDLLISPSPTSSRNQNNLTSTQKTGIAVGISLVLIAMFLTAYKYGVRQSEKRYERQLELAQQQLHDDAYNDEFDLALGGSGGTQHHLRHVHSPTNEFDGQEKTDKVEVLEFDYATHGEDGRVRMVDDYEVEGEHVRKASTYDELLSSLDSISALRGEKEEEGEGEDGGKSVEMTNRIGSDDEHREII